MRLDIILNIGLDRSYKGLLWFRIINEIKRPSPPTSPVKQQQELCPEKRQKVSLENLS